MALRLGHILVERGVISEHQRVHILEEQRATGRPFGELAERLFGVEPAAVEDAWAEQFSTITRWVEPESVEPETDALTLLTRRQAWQFKILPLGIEHDELTLCTAKRHLVRALKFADSQFSHTCVFVLAEPEPLGRALLRHYPMAGMTEHLVSGAARIGGGGMGGGGAMDCAGA